MSDTKTAPPALDSPVAPSHRSEPLAEGSSTAVAIVSTMLTTALTLLGLAVIAGVLGSALGFYRLDIILSGSMSPTYAPGDIVVARQMETNRLSPGDVIMFNTPDAYGGEKVTHRVVGVKMDDAGVVIVRTKGDGNEDVDPWNAVVSTREVWVVENRIPKAGFVAHWAKSWWATLLAGVISLPMLGYARRRVGEAYATSAAPRHAADAAPVQAQDQIKDGDA